MADEKTIASFIGAEVLALTYTAHDMAPSARRHGLRWCVKGNVLPPFVWDAEDRAHPRPDWTRFS